MIWGHFLFRTERMIKPLPWPAALPPEAHSSTMVSLITLDGPNHTQRSLNHREQHGYVGRASQPGHSRSTWKGLLWPLEPPQMTPDASKTPLPAWLWLPGGDLVMGFPWWGKEFVIPYAARPDRAKEKEWTQPCLQDFYSVKLLHFQCSHISPLSTVIHIITQYICQ